MLLLLPEPELPPPGEAELRAPAEALAPLLLPEAAEPPGLLLPDPPPPPPPPALPTEGLALPVPLLL